jgi:hypothetical protein
MGRKFRGLGKPINHPPGLDCRQLDVIAGATAQAVPAFPRIAPVSDAFQRVEIDAVPSNEWKTLAHGNLRTTSSGIKNRRSILPDPYLFCLVIIQFAQKSKREQLENIVKCAQSLYLVVATTGDEPIPGTIVI